LLATGGFFVKKTPIYSAPLVCSISMFLASLEKTAENGRLFHRRSFSAVSPD